MGQTVGTRVGNLHSRRAQCIPYSVDRTFYQGDDYSVFSSFRVSTFHVIDIGIEWKISSHNVTWRFPRSVGFLRGFLVDMLGRRQAPDRAPLSLAGSKRWVRRTLPG